MAYTRLSPRARPVTYNFASQQEFGMLASALPALLLSNQLSTPRKDVDSFQQKSDELLIVSPALFFTNIIYMSRFFTAVIDYMPRRRVCCPIYIVSSRPTAVVMGLVRSLLMSSSGEFKLQPTTGQESRRYQRRGGSWMGRDLNWRTEQQIIIFWGGFI